LLVLLVKRRVKMIKYIYSLQEAIIVPLLDLTTEFLSCWRKAIREEVCAMGGEVLHYRNLKNERRR